MSSMPALVLDFDGVIADSCRETFEVALVTHREFVPATRLDRLSHDLLYRRFAALMPFGNRAEDFGVALAALEAEVEIVDQAAYWAFAKRKPASWLAQFHSRFYENRRKLREQDLRTWLSWTPPYAKFVALVPRLAQRWTLAIATAKDRASVELLLREYRIAEFFSADLICDKETGVSKSEHLRVLQARLKIPFEQMTFLDDKVNHLDAVAALPLRCILAAWGYNTEREQQLARAQGYGVLEIDRIESVLLGAHS